MRNLISIFVGIILAIIAASITLLLVGCDTPPTAERSTQDLQSTTDLTADLTQDLTVDLSADLTVDLVTLDLSQPDLLVQDLSEPDLITNDLVTLDLSQPDLSQPDLVVLDSTVLDLTQPDLTPPCGPANGPCCPDGSCAEPSLYACSEGVCVRCGLKDKICCKSNKACLFAECLGGYCRCGGYGQLCCPCDKPYQCQDNGELKGRCY